ncbi:lysosomal alpha-mannosidase-like [Ostrinia nubilalis]|uniref:lysosomal alpha-mannosidase-like n=1 Tax=Ostrinia nubilalis TaxID=29057 RepID=UPI0030826016
MDAGWVKTFDEYYYGTRTTVSSANVQLIFHSVLSELLHDKRRKFTFSESAYFWRWWKEQRPLTRATFRSLVQEGRVEFAGGGWVQNDEAAVDYLQLIDQYTWGLRKLNDTLGICGKPKAAWQIDTYGHTREQASLLAQMGFDGLFIGRVDHKEREAMIEEDRMEFMWRGSDVLGKMSDIMTHTLFNLYNAPDGFCFDFLCNDEPIIDDPDNKVYNAERRVNDFIAQIERQAKYYDHDNIMVTMGGDFTYQSAANWFMNMDKLINHVNTHPANLSDINIFYSSPSCYLKAIYLYGRRDKAMYTEKGDHVPYDSDASTYWTGYYSSRPTLKYLARRAHLFLQVVKQITVIARTGDSYELHLLRHAVALTLHHDAITGTSQQHVANDFTRLLSEAMDTCSKKVSNLLSYLTPTWGSSRRSKNNQQFVTCHQMNVSQCRFLETQDAILLLVYNPLSVKTYHYVRLPAIALHYSIRDYNDEEVEYQLVPLPKAVINVPGRTSSAIQDLVFEAENIPPLGFTAYYITPVRDQLEENSYAKKHSVSNSEADMEVIPYITNEYLRVSVNKDTGFLESIQHVDGVKVQVSQNWYYYKQAQQTLQSGAYSFRPDSDRPTPVTEKVTYHAVRGSLVKEIRQRFSDWITQVIRLYRGEEFLEVEWVVGPVPLGTDLGKEVVSVFSTNITNSGEFSTDSNGRQMMRRSCWNDSTSHQQKKPVASCYYPVTSRICIHSLNTSVELCVLTDRAQGGTSYNEGEIELMVHRRLLTDDGFGLEESLNEEAHGAGLVVKGKHRILFGNFRQEVDDLTFSERVAHAARRWQMEPWLFFASGEKINRRKWQNVRNKRFSSLRLHGLPRHINILTLEPWKAGSVLLRLENTLEKPLRGNMKEKVENPEDYATKSSFITVELRKIFLQMQIKMIRETTLAANQWLDDARQMDWSTRYVYTGGDDGILPEDNDMDKEEGTKQNDGAEPVNEEHYSDEDQNYRKKPPRQKYYSDKVRSKIRTQKPSYDYERRKRSINITENINENIINNTFDDVRTELTNDVKFNESITTVKDTEVPIFVYNLTTTEMYKKVTKKPQRLSFWSKTARPNRFSSIMGRDSAEIVSEEEDFSSNMKKRLPRRRKLSNVKRTRPPVPETPTDDCDDGITKSMYEMYYKTPRFYPKSRNVEDEPRFRRKKKKTRRYRQNYDYEESTASLELTTKRTKGRPRRREKFTSVDMPFFLTDRKKVADDSGEEVRRELVEEINQPKDGQIPHSTNIREKRRRPLSQEYDDSESEEDEKEVENDYKDYGKRTESRRKRDIKEDDGADPTNSKEQEVDMDYVITLRPTQIRTFVVWFHESRKAYT